MIDVWRDFFFSLGTLGILACIFNFLHNEADKTIRDLITL